MAASLGNWAGMESRPPAGWGLGGGGLAGPQLEERLAHGLWLGRGEPGLKDMPALMPAIG